MDANQSFGFIDSESDPNNELNWNDTEQIRNRSGCFQLLQLQGKSRCHCTPLIITFQHVHSDGADSILGEVRLTTCALDPRRSWLLKAVRGGLAETCDKDKCCLEKRCGSSKFKRSKTFLRAKLDMTLITQWQAPCLDFNVYLTL